MILPGLGFQIPIEGMNKLAAAILGTFCPTGRLRFHLRSFQRTLRFFNPLFSSFAVVSDYILDVLKVHLKWI